MTLMNSKAWDNLPADTQQVLIECGNTVNAEALARIQGDVEKAWQTLRDNGVEIYKLSSDELPLWIGALNKTYDVYRKAVGDDKKIDSLFEAIRKYR